MEEVVACLWIDRNNMVNKGIQASPVIVLSRGLNFLQDYINCRMQEVPRREEHSETRCPPLVNFFKLNYDASIKNGKALEGMVSIEFAKGMAILFGLEGPKECGFQKLLVESDAKDVIARLHKEVNLDPFCLVFG
ncbi:conserved hypothetical protein [Ricinus communis]|uniref:Uncharacterized protein n=1 Tax=Ricinus communis TaxID=3988 RepID=B9T075_RICCO|nr:conserved hypothetical protein [Ricinus communis]